MAAKTLTRGPETPATSITLSIAAMAFLTIAVGIRLFLDRSREMREKCIHPQAVATSRKIAEKLEAVQAADNFRNLFEVPVLFCALHAVHSYIQGTYDKVMHRFAVFIASFLVAVAPWVLFVVQFLTHT